jgi:chromate reductase
MVKLLGLSGSLRAGSYNSMLVREAARVFAPDEFVFANLRLPLYDGDLEARGMPEPVLALCDQIREADAIVISTPEYNKNPSGVLKNALDWISRVRPVPLAGKPVAVVSAAAGLAGGQRATAALYLMLIPFKVRLVAEVEVAVGNAASRFDGDGRLTDERLLAALGRQMAALRVCPRPDPGAVI